MNARWQLPAKDRPGKRAWLGPVSLCLGVVSWAIPGGGTLIAAGAIACGVASMATRAEYRLDWTAITGTCAGAGQLPLSLMLFAMAASSH